MKKHFEKTQTVGEIVAGFPGAADIFRKYKIDYCCGGNRSLADAAGEINQDAERIANEINEKCERHEKSMEGTGQDTDWTTADPTRLIEHILSTHHAYLHAEMPRISELLLKVLRAHGENHGELKKVYMLYGQLRTELEMHLLKEEETLFPAMIAYLAEKDEAKKREIGKTIEELQDEHEGAGSILKTLRMITKDYSLPEDACPTFELTYEKLESMEKDIHTHVHLENNILFKKAE